MKRGDVKLRPGSQITDTRLASRTVITVTSRSSWCQTIKPGYGRTLDHEQGDILAPQPRPKSVRLYLHSSCLGDPQVTHDCLCSGENKPTF